MAPFNGTDLDLDYGLQISTDTSKKFKRLVWGKLSFGAGDWDLSTKAEASHMRSVDVSVDADCSRAELKLNARAKVGFNQSLVESIYLKKRFGVGGGELTIHPILNLDRRTRALSLTFAKNEHIVALASNDLGKSVRLSRQFGQNLVSTILRDNGSVAVQLKRSLGHGDSIMATIQPEKNIGITWVDRGWTTMFTKSLTSSDSDTTMSKKIRLL